MSELRTEDILRDKKSDEPSSVTALSLNHKALTLNVYCLSDFNNLERLDLSFNSLTSLKGLESCYKLKWLSVLQNNLPNLKGIEALPNLLVLNAGKNKLRSMDEVKNLLKLRALILNDNEIPFISGLDQLLELNTLVLSRNPIRKLGISLTNQKSIVRISLSNCLLEDIDNSIKACTKLEQLRLAHNNIKTLPEGLSNSKKLQILDLGNNMISRWSDLEALSSLHNLKNLNLLGNPIADKVKLLKKVKKLVPNLHILNSKKFDYLSFKKDQKVDGAVVSLENELKPLKNKKKASNVKHCDVSPNNSMDVDFDEHVNHKGLTNDQKLVKDRGLDDKINFMSKDRKLKVGECNADEISDEEYPIREKRDPRKKDKYSRKAKTSKITEGKPDGGHGAHIDGKNEQKTKVKHANKVLVQEADETIIDKRSKRKVMHLDVIDDKETPFSELVANDATESVNPNDGLRRNSQGVGKFDTVSALVTYPAKKKKSKNQVSGASVLQFLTPEFGLGGPSAWTDDEE